MPLFLQSSGQRKPLVSYSTRERANIVPSKLMPRKTRRKTATRRRKAARPSNKVRLVGGRVGLRVTGYPGLQALAPSALIRFIPTTKLRLAARRVLRATGQSPTRRIRRVAKKRKRTVKK